MRKKANVSKLDATQHESSPRLSADVLFGRIVNELIRSRIRHRALLEALADAGQLDIGKYRQIYSEMEARDYRVMGDLLVLPKDQFETQHREWLEAEHKRFGFHRRAPIPQIQFDASPPSETARKQTSPAKTHRQARSKIRRGDRL